MNYTLHQGDCLEFMATLPDNSVDLIATDPPYFRVKNLEWDRQWKDSAAFIGWIGELCAEWRRILKPNGSLYCFASPQMAARVECKIGESFNVLNSIVWAKPERHYLPPHCGNDMQRSFIPLSERIIFAEQHSSDYEGLPASGFFTVMRPLREYFLDAWRQSNLSKEKIYQIFEKDGRYSSAESIKTHASLKIGWHPTRWDLCDERLYSELQNALPLHRPYEDLRREYEDLRRPFNVSAQVPYTDVWDFPTVAVGNGKHPCEKPFALMRHIIEASSRKGDTVLDCFMGSGVTGEAALATGRRFIGCDADEHWVNMARNRISRHDLMSRQTIKAKDAALTGLFALETP